MVYVTSNQQNQSQQTQPLVAQYPINSSQPPNPQNYQYDSPSYQYGPPIAYGGAYGSSNYQEQQQPLASSVDYQQQTGQLPGSLNKLKYNFYCYSIA